MGFLGTKTTDDVGYMLQGSGFTYEITKSEWFTRPTGEDGDILHVTDTNAVYIWDATAEEWVRPELLGVTTTLVGKVPQTITSSAQLVGFSESVTNGGEIVYTSGYMDIDSFSADNETANIQVGITADTSTGFYVCGYMRAVSSQGGAGLACNSISFNLGDSSNFSALILRQPSVDSPRFAGPTAGATQDNPSGYNGSVSSQLTWVEVYRDTNGVWRAWVDNSDSPVLLASDGPVVGSGTAYILLGDTSGAGRGRMYIRAITALTF
jgi:hypothetical protein